MMLTNETILVTVTYGERSAYLLAMYQRACEIGVTALVIVDNGSPADNAAELTALKLDAEKSNQTAVHLLRHERNLGSAKGFSAGIEYARQHLTFEYLWLMDDDNLPAHDSLDKLLSFYQQLPETTKPIALQCMRKPGMNSVNDVVILQPRNNFLGFHIGTVWQKLSERIWKPATPTTSGLELPLMIPAAPYGGFFMNRQCLDAIGLPNEKLVLYLDDYEYSHRIVKLGGQIWLIPDAIAQDVEVSFHMDQGRKPVLYHSILDAKHDFRVYYSNRNTLYFYEHFYKVDNKLVYLINRFIFLTFITIAATLRGKQDRLRLLKKAIRDAKEESLGYSIELP